MPFFPFSRGKNRISLGVENRGSLISVPLVLREIITRIKLLFSNYLGRYSYSFRARQELIFRYSYSFVGLTGICLYSYSSVQLHKKMVRGIIFENYSLQLHKKMVFELKM